jgi:type VI secretion system secreted protein VgrG
VNVDKPQRFDEMFVVRDEESGLPIPFFRYRIEDASGRVLRRGTTDAEGRTARVFTEKSTQIRLLLDEQ